jgi:hypothetical protein
LSFALPHIVSTQDFISVHVIVALDTFAIQFAPMEHIKEIAEVLDVNSFAFLVVIDVKHDVSLFAFTENFCVTHEVIGADDLAVLDEPVYDFRCGHGFAKIELEVAYHNVSIPEFWFVHLNHSIVCV